MAKIIDSPVRKQFKLSSGEIHYLYWHIQGSIMVPEIRHALRRAWGFCERHAWASILVETGFRHDFMFGPAILYEDILSLAISAFNFHGPLKNLRLRRNLREKGACIMCEGDYGPETEGMASEDIIEKGGNPSHLRSFALRTRKYWEKTVCGRCLGNESLLRCRCHLVQDSSKGLIAEISLHRNMIEHIFEHIGHYHRSFLWDFRGTGTEEDQAALISAVGWCSGWGPLLSILEMETESTLIKGTVPIEVEIRR